MAGSYNHVVTNSGNLASNERVVGMLENGGDVFEAVEQMFGMIWYLAGELGSGVEDADTVKESVEKACQNYKEGLELSKTVHRVSPDSRRD